MKLPDVVLIAFKRVNYLISLCLNFSFVCVPFRMLEEIKENGPKVTTVENCFVLKR